MLSCSSRTLEIRLQDGYPRLSHWPSKPATKSAEQISTELNSVVVMEARQIEMHLTRFKGKGVEMGHRPTSDLLFRENENPFSARQLSDFREVGSATSTAYLGSSAYQTRKTRNPKRPCPMRGRGRHLGELAAKSKIDNWLLKMIRESNLSRPEKGQTQQLVANAGPLSN